MNPVYQKYLLVVVLILFAAVGVKAAERRFKLPPETAELKPGPGRDAAKVSCLLCHSADYISTQPKLEKSGWIAEVQKMREKYGAPISTNQVDSLVEYLVTNYGKPAKPSP
ncbi:MAG TPA: cytochrome c [Candidatus Limnocylindria bacterium]|jgi:hypothetical protein|nr:cytochrome c [Candidatus Limnocylindria bacterium]